MKLPLVFGLLLAVGSSGCVGCDKGYSEGERTGFVVKLSQKGVIWKSWEGSMHLAGGAGGGGGSGSDTWEFSVTDTRLVPEIQKAQESGVRVTLHYQQWAARPVSIETQYEVDAVKVSSPQ